VTVAICDRDDDALEQAAASLATKGARSVTLSGDVTQTTDVERALARLCAEAEPPTILINAAGILRATSFLDITDAEWDAVLGVSVRGSFLVSRACVPGMVEAGSGRIVNFSSTAGKSVSTLGGVHYTTAKAALLGFTRALASELAPLGVTVNAICPGLFDTEMTRSTVGLDRLRQVARDFPIPRLGDPGEVGELVAFLCGPHASYITGAALDINGGDLMV
jgi:NAD(P)-dependent dehydrogenase (short-subunit alcohol dehydrogenase family)